MLKEWKDLPQRKGERRRCFTDGVFELYTWHEPDGSIRDFQLLYLLGDGPMRALLWSREDGCRHCGVDSGEGDGFQHDMGRAFSGTQEPFDKARVLEEFTKSAAGLEPGLRSRIIKAIRAAA